MPRDDRTFQSADVFPEIPLIEHVCEWVGFYLLVNSARAYPYDMKSVTSMQDVVNAQIGRNIYRGLIQDVLLEYREAQDRGEFGGA